MRERKILFCALLTALFVCSCASRPSSIVSSTSPVPPGVRGTIPAYGSNCEYHLLGIIPVTGSPDSQAALDDAKASAGADVLTDVTTDFGGGYYILFSNNCVRVQGKGVPREVSDGWNKKS